MNRFAGTKRLVRLVLRRDRVKLPIAILSIATFVPILVAGVKEIFATEEGNVEQLVVFLSANPATRLFGLPTGGEMGDLLMLRSFVMFSVAVGLVSTFLVVRHTRQNEELGRAELVGSASVGRDAGLSAALIVAFGVNAVIAALSFLGLWLNDLPIAGSLAMGVSIGLTGLAFAAFAAVIVQIAKSSRGANALAALAVGVAFLMSGLGSVLGKISDSGLEVTPAVTTWLNPIGWGQLMYPYAGEIWWMALVFIGFIAVCVLGANKLASKRDIGIGLLPEKSGRDRAPKSLLGLGGLASRLYKGAFIGWAVGIVALAALYGAVASSVQDLLESAEGAAEIFVDASGTDDIVLAYLGAIMSILGVFTLAYSVQLVLRLRSEEKRALEFLLTSSVDRKKWAITTISFVVVSTALILLIAATVAGLVAGVAINDLGIIWPLLVGGLIQIPAILVIVGFVVLVFGVWPRLTNSLAWLALSVGIIFSPFFSSILNLPQWVINVSPFAHVPIVPPLENIEALPIVVFSVIATILTAIGVIAFKRRDID